MSRGLGDVYKRQAQYDEKTNTYKDPELFSMLTLDSDALKSLKRGVIIEYLIYA